MNDAKQKSIAYLRKEYNSQGICRNVDSALSKALDVAIKEAKREVIDDYKLAIKTIRKNRPGLSVLSALNLDMESKHVK